MSVDPFVKKFQKELNAGAVSLVLLAILARSAQPMYGYQIAKYLQEVAGELPVSKQAALYPVLRSMSASGLLASRVEPSTSGPPRRYYTITALGRDVLERWRAAWRHTRTFVDSIVEDEEDLS